MTRNRDMTGPARSAVVSARRHHTLPELDHCCICGASSARLTLHHEDYQRPLDLMVLCQSCHSSLHGCEKRLGNLSTITSQYPISTARMMILVAHELDGKFCKILSASTPVVVPGPTQKIVTPIDYRIPDDDPIMTGPWMTGPWTGVPLRRLRFAAGLSLTGLARLVAAEPGCDKVSAQTVQANEPGENGGRAPNATLLGAYARVLGVTADALLSVEAATAPGEA